MARLKTLEEIKAEFAAGKVKVVFHQPGQAPKVSYPVIPLKEA